MNRNPLRRRSREESGQALILVLLISILVMLMIGTASTTLVSQIKPAKRSLDDGQAMAAAQAGLENFTAQVNSNCADDPSCTWLQQGLTYPTAWTSTQATDTAYLSSHVGTLVTGADNTGTAGSFVWTVLFKAPYVARVRSVGQVPADATHTKYRTVTLVADFNAQPGFPDLEYYTKYETYSSDYLNALYAQRKVYLNSGTDLSSSQLAGGNLPGTIQWAGVPVPTDPSYPIHGTGICEDLYYDSGTGTGRGTNSAYYNLTGRRPNTSSDFAWFQETGTYTPSSGSTKPVTHNDTCDVSFEPDMTFNGPIYTQDAYLLNDVKNNNKGTVFNNFAYSLWNGMINGAQTSPPNPSIGPLKYYRTFATYPLADGGGEPEGSKRADFPVYTTNKLDLPADPTKAQPLATCTYTGPTRILVKDDVAWITSPGTPADGSGTSPCYTSTGSWTNQNSAVGGGVVMAKVPVNRAIIYVKNPSVLTPTTATKASPVFQVKSSLTVPLVTGADTFSGKWTDDATYSATAACPSPADATKRRNLDCEVGTATPRGDVFAKFKAAADAVGSDTTVPDADVKQRLINQMLAQVNTTVVSQNDPTGTAVQYKLVVGNPSTPTVTNVTPPPLSPADPFLQSSTGGGYSTSTTSWPVTLTRYTCKNINGNGGCTSYNSTLVFDGAATRARSTGTSPVNSRATFPWFGSSTSYNDVDTDVTQYLNGYGDAYVEGRLDGQLSVVAEHDIVLTNNVSYANTDLTTTNDGYAFISGHDVRVYRPLTCKYDAPVNSTSPGWCPNDTTGTYTTLPDWPGYPPATVYTDLDPAKASSMATGKSKNSDSYVYGSIFALRGSFRVDNVARGGDDGNINVYGGLYMYHRGVTKVQFQGHPAQSSIERPGMTLKYNYDNLRAGQNPKGGLRVPWVPTPSGQVANRTWNITALSSGS